MSLPKAGKAPLKGPQSQAGFTIPKMGGGAGSSPATIKTLIQQGTKFAQIAQKKSHGDAASATKPDTSGTKITKVIQSGTKASHSK